MLSVNDPAVIAEITALHDAYERALAANDIPALNAFFWDSPHIVRYGVNEQLYSYAEIKGFRAGRATIDLRRELLKLVLTTYGRDFATASCEYKRLETGRRGRQMQTWMRVDGEWKVIAAHVSLLPA